MNNNNPVASKKMLALLNALAFILVLVMNTLAVTLPINGKTTRQVSDKYPNLFTPAGFTFSIWSVIYLLLLGFVIYQVVVLLKTHHRSSEKILHISIPFIINCLANAGWILAWHYEQVLLSVVIMLVILLSLISIFARLKLALPARPITEKLWIDLPFSLYLGWISIATIANITALLVDLHWNGGGIDPSYWTVIMISAGTLINIYMILFKNNIPFGMVGIWAFAGIILKRQAAEDGNIDHIIPCAQICISLIAVSIILQILKYWKQTAMGDMIKSKI